MNSWKVILATVVIFGTGVLTGGLLVNYVDHAHGPNGRFPFIGQNPPPQMGDQRPMHPGELPRPRSPELWRKEFIGHLDKDLHLTREQHAAILKIIAGGQEENQEIWRTNAAPQMRRVMEQTLQHIRGELTPEQQKHFDQMVRRFAPHRPQRPGEPASSNEGVPPSPNTDSTGP